MSNKLRLFSFDCNNVFHYCGVGSCLNVAVLQNHQCAYRSRIPFFISNVKVEIIKESKSYSAYILYYNSHVLM